MAVRKNRKSIFLLVAICVFAVLTTGSILGGVLTFFEQKLLDFRFQVANPQRKPSQDVVFVDVDDESLATLSKDIGTWPWARGSFISNRIVDYIQSGNPAAVLFDVLYSEYSPKTPDVEIPDEDLIMVEDATAFPNISHAVQFQNPHIKDLRDPGLPESAPSTFEMKVAAEKSGVSLPEGAAPTLPFKELATNAWSMHLLNEDPDSDGVSRRYTLLMKYKDKFYPSLALKSLQLKFGFEGVSIDDRQLITGANPKPVPLLEDGRMQLVFYPNLDDFAHYPIDSVLQSSQAVQSKDETRKPILPASLFEGKIVIIGATAIGLKDLKITPMGQNYGGPFLHMTAISNILQGDFLYKLPPLLEILMILASIAIIIVVTLWIPNSVLRSVLGIAWIIIVTVACVLVFRFGLIEIDMANTVVFSVLALLGSIIFLSQTEGAEKRYIRGAFSTYLSPEVIKQLESDPSKLKLGGEKRHMTAMFTDVKGFSTFSEKLDPNDLVALLNEYLTRMSDIILDNSGTIDKYEGDAIIAFWGAPLVQTDHVEKALVSALTMHRIEAELSARLVASKLAPSPLYTRIGINTGDMTVGNMGTPRRMNYTIMGNAVNLAARLEGVNKQYGTSVLTAQSTREVASDRFVFRGLDRVMVVGIKAPVRLFEVVEERSFVDADLLSALELFQKGIEHYEGQEWQKAIATFEEVLRMRPGDGPSQTFLGRAKEYQTNPPPKNWSGVYELTTK